MKISIKFSIAALCTMLLSIIVSYLDSVVKPLLGNQAAINQMTNTADSNIWIQSLDFVTGYGGWVIWIIIMAIIFAKEIGEFISRLGDLYEKD